MGVKLYEIAKASGVSISTVSRILNNDKVKPASKSTTERVLQAAYNLGYDPAKIIALEQSSNSLSTRNLACFLASASDNFNDSFFAQILSGIQEEAHRLGYTISHMLSTSGMSLDAVYAQITTVHPCGVILLGRVSKEIMKKVRSITKNIIYSGLNRLDSGIDEVICDAYAAIESAVNYLISIGYRRIGFVGAIPENNSNIINEHRFDAFSHTILQHGLPLHMELCSNITLGSEQAYLAIHKMIKKGDLPDAICCANDAVAIGVIGALIDCHYRVPDDISVIGMDDIETARFMSPRLTTFNMQNRELGRFAVKVLDDRIRGMHNVPVLLQLKEELVQRDSCIPYKSNSKLQDRNK